MFTYSFFLSNPCKFIFAARSGQAWVWLTLGGFKKWSMVDTSGRSGSTVARGPNWQSASNSWPSPSSWPLGDLWMGGVMKSTFEWWNEELNRTPSSHHHRRQTRPSLFTSPDLPLVGGEEDTPPARRCIRWTSVCFRVAGDGEDTSVDLSAAESSFVLSGAAPRPGNGRLSGSHTVVR